MDKKLSRRQFLSSSAALGAAGLVAPAILSSCNSNRKTLPLRKEGEYYVPGLEDKAIEGRELKVGLVGCGGRGCGALDNLLEAADGIKVTALGDVFPDKVESERVNLKGKGIEVPEDHCFVGFDSYKNVIDSGIDMVILTTPPVFRPEMFQYATQKGVHSFLEKPISVDAKGYRQIIATARQAQAKGLSVVTGTQRHHQREYVEAFKLIQQGIIGEITGGNVYWNQEMLWYKNREQGWSDMEWMIRDWVNWKWLSGDHIVEQHVHNIDVFMWMTGKRPVKACGFGARHGRITGDQNDQFSVDFEFENGVHLHSMCQQINGCDMRVAEIIRGTKGWWQWDNNKSEIFSYNGDLLWSYDLEKAKSEHSQFNPYVLEHVDWVNHIRRGEAHDEASDTAYSCLAGAMGRESAYTGKVVTWDEYSASPQDFMPAELKLGAMDMTHFTVKHPGK